MCFDAMNRASSRCSFEGAFPPNAYSIASIQSLSVIFSLLSFMVSPFYSFGLRSSFMCFLLSSSIIDTASHFTVSFAVSISVHRFIHRSSSLWFSGIMIGSTE